MRERKRARRDSGRDGQRSDSDPFEGLPDDLVICVLSKLCSSASCPSDLINALLVCKRFNRLGVDPTVLAGAGSNLFKIRAKKWSESAHRFLKQCVNASSIEARYFLGMIRFYCLGNRGSGASLMAKAAIRSHAPALYSLSLIQFNGSGGSKSDKDLRAGVALCARAAYLGHIDALRELGHCLQDGYGVRQNFPEGRRLLVQANARELSLVFGSLTKSSNSSLCRCSSSTTHDHHGHHLGDQNPRHDDQRYNGCHKDQTPYGSNVNTGPGLGIRLGTGQGCGLLSDFGCDISGPDPHPANGFLVEWFGLKCGPLGFELRMCSHSRCGRPETRPHEFRRCSVCGVASYCSRGCQSRDWKMRHKDQCVPTEQWLIGAVAGDGGGNNNFGLGLGVLEIGEAHNES